MYRLLIVDDEADIADSLYMYFQENGNAELDVYRAYSAHEALRWLEQTRMDVVVTDIRMPGMTGIQLLEKIRGNWPACKVIFLTGHDEFEYAQSAIKYGSAGYILKTEGYEEVATVVGKAIAEIEESVQNREMIDQARLQMKTAIPLMQSDYLLALIQGESCAAEERVQHFKQLNLPLCPASPVMLMIARLENMPEGLSWLDKSGLIHSVKQAFEQHLAPAVAQVGILGERMNLVWFIQPRSILESGTAYPDETLEWKRTALFIRGTAETLQNICMKTLHVQFSVIMDSAPASWESVADLYDALKFLGNAHLGAGVKIAILDRRLHDDIETVREDGNRPLPNVRLRQLKLLETHLERGDNAAFAQLLKEITAARHGSDAYYALSLMFLSYIERWNLARALGDGAELDKLSRTDGHRSWAEATEHFFRLADSLFGLRSREEENRAFAAINQVKKYIEDNYGEDLSLVKLAEIVYLNPSYLSRLFKQVTGSNLLHYINEVRIGHAKLLLQENELKIHQIAKRVGYLSAPYFTRFFRRLTNMSPQEYRDLFSKG